MRWLLNLIQSIQDFFATRRDTTRRRHLMSMYFGESNQSGRRKPNRDRA